MGLHHLPELHKIIAGNADKCSDGGTETEGVNRRLSKIKNVAKARYSEDEQTRNETEEKSRWNGK